MLVLGIKWHQHRFYVKIRQLLPFRGFFLLSRVLLSLSSLTPHTYIPFLCIPFLSVVAIPFIVRNLVQFNEQFIHSASSWMHSGHQSTVSQSSSTRLRYKVVEISEGISNWKVVGEQLLLLTSTQHLTPLWCERKKFPALFNFIGSARLLIDSIDMDNGGQFCSFCRTSLLFLLCWMVIIVWLFLRWNGKLGINGNLFCFSESHFHILIANRRATRTFV